MNILLRLPIFYRYFGPKDESKNSARERLKAALVSDRNTVAPALLECIERDVKQALKAYLITTDEGANFCMKKLEGQMTLAITIPVEQVRRQSSLPEDALKDTLAPTKSAEIRLKRRKLRKKRRSSRPAEK